MQYSLVVPQVQAAHNITILPVLPHNMSVKVAAQSLRKAAHIIMVGCPGAGKGTQSTRVLKAFPDLRAISSGDILRENVMKGTEIGRELSHYRSILTMY